MLNKPFWALRLIGTAVLCWLSLAVIAKTAKPVEVRLSWLRDFRDLSRVLAGEREGGWPGFEVITRPTLP